MSPVPASAITIADGEITIDAELLAHQKAAQGLLLATDTFRGGQ